MTAPRSSFRALLIEDNPDDAELVRRALGRSHDAVWQLEHVDRLASGLEALGGDGFDVVLLDLGLPDASGESALDLVRAQDPHVPIVVLTRHDDEQAGVALLRRGAQDYLPKEHVEAGLLNRAVGYAIERARGDQELRASEERYRLLVEDAPDIIYRADEGGRFIFANSTALRILGYADHEVRGRHFLELIREDYRQSAAEFYGRQSKERVPQTYFEFPALPRDGSELWIGQNVSLLPDGQGYQAVARDITERKRLEQQRDRYQADLKQFFDLSVEMLCIMGLDGSFKELNRAWERTLGFSLDELKALSSFELVHPDDRAATAAEWDRLQEGAETVSFENRYRCRDGSYRHLLWSAVFSPERGLYYAAARDITDRKQREDRLVREALYDALTGLPNRPHVMNKLERLLARAHHGGPRLGVLYLDLDGFKGINDSLGHDAGDEYLVRLVRRMECSVRPGDLVGRLGGDEFVVLLEGIADEAQALQVAERIQRALAEPLRLHGRELTGGASIGITLSAPRHERPMDLLRESDAAMYQAKTSGRRRAAVWRDPG